MLLQGTQASGRSGCNGERIARLSSGPQVCKANRRVPRNCCFCNRSGKQSNGGIVRECRSSAAGHVFPVQRTCFRRRQHRPTGYTRRVIWCCHRGVGQNICSIGVCRRFACAPQADRTRALYSQCRSSGTARNDLYFGLRVGPEAALAATDSGSADLFRDCHRWRAAERSKQSVSGQADGRACTNEGGERSKRPGCAQNVR